MERDLEQQKTRNETAIMGSGGHFSEWDHRPKGQTVTVPSTQSRNPKRCKGRPSPNTLNPKPQIPNPYVHPQALKP